MWKNIVERDRSQMKIWRTRIACWITKATNTHSQYIILMIFHYNNVCKNAPQHYVIRTLPVLLNYMCCLLSGFVDRVISR